MENTEKNMDFFLMNDAKVNKKLAKMLLWMTLVFPVLFVLTALKVFWIKFDDLIRLSLIGCVCTMGPYFLQKKGVSAQVLENLHSSEQVAMIMEKCGNVSENLVKTMDMLADDVSETEKATDAIVTSAKETLDNCATSMEHVEFLQNTVNKMVETTDSINGKTEQPA